MQILSAAVAGTLESNDAFVEISPGRGLVLTIESPVLDRYGAAIERAVRETLASFAVTDAAVRVTDRGALDCVLRARTETAILRAAKGAGTC